jgi:hypothetical protein
METFREIKFRDFNSSLLVFGKVLPARHHYIFTPN